MVLDRSAKTFLPNSSSLWFLPCYRLCRSTWGVDGMAELPRSLPEFEARFPDDAACARWLLEKRWPDGFRCPACGHDKSWELGRERLTLQCAAGTVKLSSKGTLPSISLVDGVERACCPRP